MSNCRQTAAALAVALITLAGCAPEGTDDDPGEDPEPAEEDDGAYERGRR